MGSRYIAVAVTLYALYSNTKRIITLQLEWRISDATNNVVKTRARVGICYRGVNITRRMNAKMRIAH